MVFSERTRRQMRWDVVEDEQPKALRDQLQDPTGYLRRLTNLSPVRIMPFRRTLLGEVLVGICRFLLGTLITGLVLGAVAVGPWAIGRYVLPVVRIPVSATNPVEFWMLGFLGVLVGILLCVVGVFCYAAGKWFLEDVLDVF